jgi:hypothetical protein
MPKKVDPVCYSCHGKRESKRGRLKANSGSFQACVIHPNARKINVKGSMWCWECALNRQRRYRAKQKKAASNAKHS